MALSARKVKGLFMTCLLNPIKGQEIRGLYALVALVVALFCMSFAGIAYAEAQQAPKVGAPKAEKSTVVMQINPEESEADKLAKKRDDIRQAPFITLVEYKEALKRKSISKIKTLLNEDSLNNLSSFGFTENSMLYEAKNIEDCGQGKVKFMEERAVIYFNAEMKSCQPYFMQFQAGKWRIDLYNMQRAIRFNDKNEWRIKSRVDHPYKFMFRKKIIKK
jgi:hypothetical protein